MLLNTESEATGVTEISSQELVLLHLQAALEKLHRLLASDGHVAGDLLVAPDPERTNRVPSLREHRSQNHQKRCVRQSKNPLFLEKQAAKDFGSSGETIAAFADGDVENELLDFDVPHGARQLLLRSLNSIFFLE